MELLLTDGLVYGRPCCLGIEKGKIVYVGTERISADETIDLRGKLILPGMIDPHVHMRDMDMAYKESWESGSCAALAGGVTTVIDMPNTRPPLTDRVSYDTKRRAASFSHVHYGFYAGYDSLASLHSLLADTTRPVCGIKIFLAETSSNTVTSTHDELIDLMHLAREHQKVVLFHGELLEAVQLYKSNSDAGNGSTVLDHNTIRDPQCELDALRYIISLVRQTQTRAYICHLSTAQGYTLVKDAQAEGLPLYIELTPHHTFLSEEVLHTVGNRGKVNPPLRSEDDRAFLYEKLCTSACDTVGSDHAPHMAEEKLRTYTEAPSGIPGLETVYHLLIDQALRGHMHLQDVCRLAAENPARIFSIPCRGKIEEGMWADIAIVDPEAEWTVDPELFHTKAQYSPFSGKRLKGRVVMTFINGKLAYNDGNCMSHIHGKEVHDG